MIATAAAPYVTTSDYGTHYIYAHEGQQKHIQTLSAPADPTVQWIAFTGVIVRAYRDGKLGPVEIARELVSATHERRDDRRSILGYVFASVPPTYERICTAIDRVCAAAGIPE